MFPNAVYRAVIEEWEDVIKRPGARKRMKGHEARLVIRRWLRAKGYNFDWRASKPLGRVLIKVNEKHRVTFKRTHIVFEHGGRGNWVKNYRVHEYGRPLGTIDFAHTLVEQIWERVLTWRANPLRTAPPISRCGRCNGSGLSPVNPLVGCGECKARQA